MALRREEEYVGKRMMVMEVPGTRRRGKRYRGGWVESGREEAQHRG